MPVLRETDARAFYNRERESYQKKMKEVERQLERQSAGELGQSTPM
jgi:hypothetical protein